MNLSMFSHEFLAILVVRTLGGVRKSHCHVFLGGLDPGKAPLKLLMLMLRQTQVFLSLFGCLKYTFSK